MKTNERATSDFESINKSICSKKGIVIRDIVSKVYQDFKSQKSQKAISKCDYNQNPSKNLQPISGIRKFEHKNYSQFKKIE